MFSTFFLTELKYTLKQKMVYIFFALVTILVFAAVVSDSVMIGGAIGKVNRNAPHVITSYVTILNIFGLFFAAAFFNNAALRESKYGFQEILYATPLKKSGYFFGRFFGALILSTIPLLGVFLGVYLGAVFGPIFGWMPADRFGDFYFETFINNYLLFILPNMFFAGSIIFALATKYKNTIISFVGVLLILVTYIISGSLLSDLNNEKLGALSDMFGIRTYAIVSKYFTTSDLNSLSPSFSGLLLENRLIWIGVGLVILLLSYWAFSFSEKKKKVKRKKKLEITTKIPDIILPKTKQIFDRKMTWKQLKSFYKLNFQSIIKSITFKILFIFCIILIVSGLISGFEYFGLQTYPVTYKMIDEIGNTSSIFMMIILVFFSGELVWRDRDCKINGIIDSTPHSSFISLVAKALSLISVATLLYFFLILIAVIYQLINGYTRIELDVYLLDFFQTSFFTYIVYSCLLILIQVLLSNKYLGYFISILFIFIWETILSILHIETNMLSIQGHPYLMYSDLNGFGPGVKGALWFNSYWVLIGVIWLLIAGALWNRGTKESLKNRFKAAKHNLSKPIKYAFGIVGLVWFIVAAFIFYNTQILNDYKTGKEYEKEAVQFEKKYRKYKDVKLPKFNHIHYFIDLYPHQRDVKVKAVIQLKNESNQPIDSLHFVTTDNWKTEFKIPHSKLVHDDKKLGYKIFALDEAMQPGDELEIIIKNDYISKGFRNTTGNTSIVENGTFLTNMGILPAYGYPENAEISDPNTRKKYDLPPKERMPKLDSTNHKARMINYLSDGASDWIDVTTTISTSKDQTAIAPGSLVKEWQENNRNYYTYKVDHPSQNFYSFMSARYEKAHRKWNGIDLEVYYDKKHGVNIEKMLDAMERSLAYYTKNYGPYMHKQVRIIEFPRYSTFAQAFPGTMPYSESFGFIVNLEDESKNNVIDAVIAHEMAHQWWAHQVIGAKMQGATMLSESFAEYSSLMTMKKLTKDPMKMKQFLKYDLDRYLNGRSTETRKELPLYKVENQTYIHYGKGSVVLYALQDYIGEKKMNKALQNFLEDYRYKNPPYPTSLDFIKRLNEQVPDSLSYLVDDWIKEITLYDLRMQKAEYEKLSSGKYQVDLTVKATKIKSDSVGHETDVPINDWIDLGFFADNSQKKLQFQKRVKIDQPEMEFSFTLDSLPKKAAIDPRRILIERVYDDNSKSLEKKE